jgi:flagellar motility protein MotE (MotC chaperone)
MWLQVASLSSRLEASQAVAAAVQQAVTAVTSALAEAREQHTAELRRMTAANETLVAAAARDAAAVEARAGYERTFKLEGELARSQQRLAALEEELQVNNH